MSSDNSDSGSEKEEKKEESEEEESEKEDSEEEESEEEESEKEDSDSDSEKKVKKNKKKDQKDYIKKLVKDSLKMKIPSYDSLVKKAIQNNVSIYNRVGNKLTADKLYHKLKLLNLDQYKDEIKKKTFLKLKKKQTLDELLKITEEKQEAEIKKYRKDFFKDEEIKRFDFLYNLFGEKTIDNEKIEEFLIFEKKEEKSIDETDETSKKMLKLADETSKKMLKLELLNKVNDLKMVNQRIKEFNSFTDEYIKPTRERFVELLLTVEEENRKNIIRKYIEETNPLSFYSILLLHKCLGSNDSDMKEDVILFKKTEELLQTPEENKRLTEIALSMLKKGDIQDKIENFNKLQKLIAEMNLLERTIE